MGSATHWDLSVSAYDCGGTSDRPGPVDGERRPLRAQVGGVEVFVRSVADGSRAIGWGGGRWGFYSAFEAGTRRPRWRVPAAGFPCRSTLSAARPADGIPARCIEIPRPFGPRALPARHSARSARTIQARFSAGQGRVGDRRRPGSALLASLVAGRLGVTALLLFVLVFVGGREDLAAYARRRMRTIDADERTGLQNVVGALAADFPPLRHSRGARRTNTTAQAPRWRRGPRTGPPAARAGRALETPGSANA